MATFLDQPSTRMLRRVLDDVLTDQKFTGQSAVSAIQVAEHVWRQAAKGELDFDRLKLSALAWVNSYAGNVDPTPNGSSVDPDFKSISRA